MTQRSRVLACTLALVVALGAASCGDDSGTAATTTTTKRTSTTVATSDATTVRYDRSIQADLRSVGCYTGADDGIVGPETDAAILAFQMAAGLAPDGELGPETARALEDDASSGRKVCGATTTTTAAGDATTTTTTGGGTGLCTATDLLGGLPAEGEKIATYVCSEGYAAGSLTDGTKFVLQVQNGKWYAPGQDPCGSASAGLPPIILEDGC